MSIFSKTFFIILLIGVLASGIGFLIVNSKELPEYVSNIKHFPASVFFTQSSNPLTLQEKYENALKTGKKVKVLIVPGHEPKAGGGEYKNLKERNMTVDLALEVASYFKNDPHFEVVTTRDKDAWNPIFEKYFKEHENDIISFIGLKKAEMSKLMDNGSVTKVTNGIDHMDAPVAMARRLYGINKWSNENGVDMLIHIHFNEYPRKKQGTPGKYTGFVIYTPDLQYSNSQASGDIAKYTLSRLKSQFPVSNFPKESAGIVPGQDLIAIGSANTLDSPSFLIEYGYIYDKLFATEAKRKTTFSEMAKATYLGVQDFFKASTKSVVQ